MMVILHKDGVVKKVVLDGVEYDVPDDIQLRSVIYTLSIIGEKYWYTSDEEEFNRELRRWDLEDDLQDDSDSWW